MKVEFTNLSVVIIPETREESVALEKLPKDLSVTYSPQSVYLGSHPGYLIISNANTHQSTDSDPIDKCCTNIAIRKIARNEAEKALERMFRNVLVNRQ